MAEQQMQIVVGGEQVAVPEVAAATVFDALTSDRMMELLAESGYDDAQHIGETVQALRENGFHLPRAWAKPVRQELIDLDMHWVLAMCQGWSSGFNARSGCSVVARSCG